MSDSIHSYPFSAAGRENYDRIFRKSDPVHATTPGTIREYRSDCCKSGDHNEDFHFGHHSNSVSSFAFCAAVFDSSAGHSKSRHL